MNMEIYVLINAQIKHLFLLKTKKKIYMNVERNVAKTYIIMKKTENAYLKKNVII